MKSLSFTELNYLPYVSVIYCFIISFFFQFSAILFAFKYHFTHKTVKILNLNGKFS